MNKQTNKKINIRNPDWKRRLNCLFAEDMILDVENSVEFTNYPLESKNELKGYKQKY